MLGGVAAGIAETYGWDPTLVRLGFVILTLIHGVGLLLYLALLLFLPVAQTAPDGEQLAYGVEPGILTVPSFDRNRTLGYVLVGVGALMLANILNITVPVLALLLLGGGWYLLRHR
jgi:phage shock protein PspC (stress-responsive transcriptional regulator)